MSFKSPTETSSIAGEDSRGPLGLSLLHTPSTVLIDFIFVHGLRGGSVKTWCKGNDLRLYWPQTWIPKDTDLQGTRIHTFGYNSDWGDKADAVLDIHDFGRALLGEMATSPELRKGEQVSFGSYATLVVTTKTS